MGGQNNWHIILYIEYKPDSASDYLQIKSESGQQSSGSATLKVKKIW
jgi:hypothetical protein